VAKDLTDPAVESDDVNGVAVRNGSSDAVDHFDDDNDDSVELDVQSEPVQTFVVRHARPYESPGRSARNHWQLITVFALLGVLLGAAFAFVRSPTYTAEERLVVGKTAQLSNLASVPGLDVAGESLASSYSRLVNTDEVQAATAKKLGGVLDGSISASPIPDSAIVRLDATAPSQEHALAVAKAASAALVDAVEKLNRQQNQSAEDILDKFNAANAIVIASQDQLNRLQANIGNQTTQAGIDQVQAAINAEQAKHDTAKVQADALHDAYSGVYQPTEINSQIIQPAGGPTATGSNRRSTLEAGVLIGLVVGGLLGLGLAVWIDLRARRAQ
jgi:capsular polysaccharide biosynthesis protein